MNSILITFLLYSLIATSYGAVIIYEGNIEGLWSNSSNWPLNSIPGTNDDVIINTTSSVTIIIDIVVKLNSLTIGVNGHKNVTHTVLANNTLNFTSQLQVLGSGNLIIDFATDFYLLSPMIIGPIITIFPGAGFFPSAAAYLDVMAIYNNGTISPPSDILVNASTNVGVTSYVLNYGLFTLDSSNSSGAYIGINYFYQMSYNRTYLPLFSQFDNYGIFSVYDNDTYVSFDYVFNNYGNFLCETQGFFLGNTIVNYSAPYPTFFNQITGTFFINDPIGFYMEGQSYSGAYQNDFLNRGNLTIITGNSQAAISRIVGTMVQECTGFMYLYQNWISFVNGFDGCGMIITDGNNQSLSFYPYVVGPDFRRVLLNYDSVWSAFRNITIQNLYNLPQPLYVSGQAYVFNTTTFSGYIATFDSRWDYFMLSGNDTDSTFNIIENSTIFYNSGTIQNLTVNVQFDSKIITNVLDNSCTYYYAPLCTQLINVTLNNFGEMQLYNSTPICIQNYTTTIINNYGSTYIDTGIFTPATNSSQIMYCKFDNYGEIKVSQNPINLFGIITFTSAVSSLYGKIIQAYGVHTSWPNITVYNSLQVGDYLIIEAESIDTPIINNEGFLFMQPGPNGVITGSFDFIPPESKVTVDIFNNWYINYTLVTEPDFGTCVAWGDVHFIPWWNTPSQAHYNFQGNCDFILVNASSFNLQVRLLPCNTPSLFVTCIQAATIMYSTYMQTPVAFIDNNFYIGQTFTTIGDGDTNLYNDYNVSRLGDSLTISFPDGISVTKQDTFVTTTMPRLVGYGNRKLGGLCGQWCGDPLNIYNPANNPEFTNYQPSTIAQFGEVWAIPSGSNMNNYPFASTQACVVNPNAPTSGLIVDYCPLGTLKYNLSQAICEFLFKGIDMTPFQIYIEACIIDACTLPDITNHTQLKLLNSTVSAFITKNTNVSLSNTTFCPIGVSCDTGLVNCMIYCYYPSSSGNIINTSSVKSKPDPVLGITLGTIFACAVIAIILYFIYYRRKPKDLKKETNDGIPLQTTTEFMPTASKQTAMVQSSTDINFLATPQTALAQSGTEFNSLATPQTALAQSSTEFNSLATPQTAEETAAVYPSTSELVSMNSTEQIINPPASELVSMNSTEQRTNN